MSFVTIRDLSSTDPSEDGLSDREKRKRKGSELMAPLPGLESQLHEDIDLWGSE